MVNVACLKNKDNAKEKYMNYRIKYKIQNNKKIKCKDNIYIKIE
jgi:hypothetical protein